MISWVVGTLIPLICRAHYPLHNVHDRLGLGVARPLLPTPKWYGLTFSLVDPDPDCFPGPAKPFFRHTSHGRPLQVPRSPVPYVMEFALLDQRGICVNLTHGMQDQSGISEQC
jgi:hypothetical protein